MHTGYISGLCASNGLAIVEHKTSMYRNVVFCSVVEPGVFSIQLVLPVECVCLKCLKQLSRLLWIPNREACQIFLSKNRALS
jgi:hypothetical protein